LAVPWFAAEALRATLFPHCHNLNTICTSLQPPWSLASSPNTLICAGSRASLHKLTPLQQHQQHIAFPAMLMSWNAGGRRRAALLCASCCIPVLFIAFTTSFLHPQYFDKSFLSSKPIQSILLEEPTTTQTTSELLRPWEPPASTSNDFATPSLRPDTLPSGWAFDTQRDESNFGLDNEQCEAAFPNYYKEVDRAHDFFQKQGNITEDQVDISWREDEIVRVMIHSRQVSFHRPVKSIHNPNRYTSSM
jgi:hypothetical protein